VCEVEKDGEKEKKGIWRNGRTAAPRMIKTGSELFIWGLFSRFFFFCYTEQDG
jgi:hypothetical protein